MSNDSKNSKRENRDSRGRKIQGLTYRDYKLSMRFNKEEIVILEAVSKFLELDKANTVRKLLMKEYKRILRAKASEINMFND